MSKELTLFLLVLLSVLLFADMAFGADVHGSIYNFYLERMPDTIVSVNSTPQQLFVAKDASYLFSLPVGSYTIEVKYYEENELKYSASETIVIEKEGSYRLDLILFPSFEEENEMLSEIEETNVDDEYFESSYIGYILAATGVLVLAAVVFLAFRYKQLVKMVSKYKKEWDEDRVKENEKGIEDEPKKVIDFIKSKGGRITQKEIRKSFPSSEAKISLVISELEDKGIVKKIKKGRGNIIVLNR